MSEKIVLIDGHSILNRAFYGVPDLSNSEGIHTNAVYGFINIMLKLLDTEKPDYLTVAFDMKQPTFRHEMYKEYKGTRKPMPEELRQQVPIIQDVLKAMGIPLVMKGGLEADDILGTLAKKAESEGMEVTLLSGDRDLLQLASENIKISIPKTKKGGSEVEEYHTKEVIEKYSITPAQVVDMKGLMGDSADNIPGVPGVGEKTALKILAAFPTVDEAYEHIEEVEPKRARELLRANKDLAFLSKKLATIKTDCELDFDFEQAKLGNLFTPEAFEWIKRLELKSLIKKFDTETISTAVEQPDDFKFLESKKEIDLFVKELISSKPDIVGISFWGDEWSNSGVEIKKSKKKSGGQLSFVFDEKSTDVSIDESEESENEYLFLGLSLSYDDNGKVKTVSIIKTEDTDGDYLIDIYKKIAKKVKYTALMDWKNMMHLTAPIKRLTPQSDAPSQMAFEDGDIESTHKLFESIKDINIAAYLMNPLKDTYMVDDIARDYLGITIPSYAERFQKKRLADIVNEIEEGTEDTELLKKNLLEYTSDLAYVSCLACSKLIEELKENGMYSLYVDIEMPTAYYLYQMEREGVRADKEELAAMSKLLDEKILALETDIYDLAGEEFNINSPKQLGVILFEKMKLPFAKKTKTGYSTSADILEKLRGEDPIIPKILEYRQVTKLKSTYADGLAIYIESDNRIHGKFNQTITATGRISSTEPNLQNIPIRMELGRKLRKVFKPKEGYIFLDADYSQIELRVLAHMSGDEELREAYIEGQDIHRSTAAKVFHTPFEEVTPTQRRNAKAVNFGIVYGISAFGLSQDIGVSRKEADEIIKQYFATYPAIKSFLDGMVSQAKEKGYSETLFGRKRPVPEIKSSNFMQKSFGERIAMNSPIQGTAADIIKIAMIRVAERIRKEKLKSRIVLQVHDELLVETLESEKEEVEKILVEEMQGAVELSIPLIAEVEEGSDWYEAH
ncbi:MAG: DNA polymerase I [Lachnospiraceae bacterium]|nr:DNA polymerase I [Lachnospiraceae bacterium]